MFQLSDSANSTKTNKIEYFNCVDGGISHDISDINNDEEASLWKEPSSSPEVRPASSKKKGGGMGYLCLENDDFDITSSTENMNIESNIKSVLQSPPESDKSPEKPQSQWATFQNEEDDEDHRDRLDVEVISRGNSSLSIGMNSSGRADSINDVDGYLDDDFGYRSNRLSTEMPDLRGFNRADKGSQNNLVDFSDDRNSVAASSCSQESINEEDIETIFDLTAQGDSLKRRRRKQEKPSEKTEEKGRDTPSLAATPYHIGPAGLDDSVVAMENAEIFNSSADSSAKEDVRSCTSCSATTTPSSRLESTDSGPCNKGYVSTNPFWSPSTTNPSDSLSQASLIDSPFDKVVFKAPTPSGSEITPQKPSTPIHIRSRSSPSPSGPLFRIPPPPTSLTRSSTRSKRSSETKERVRNLSHGTMSVKKLDMDTASDASGKDLSVVRNIEISEKSTSSPLPGSENDEVFDAFFNPPENNRFSLGEASETRSSLQDGDAFNSVEKSDLNKLDSFQAFEDAEPKRNVPETRDVTLVLADLEGSEVTQNNSNANAQTHEVTNTQFHNSIIEMEEIPKKSPLTPDPLLELQKAMSVESPNGIDLNTNLSLPEVEIIDSRISWDVYMRFPREKRTMSNRKWVPIHMKLDRENVSNPLVKLYYTAKVKEPFHTVSLASHQMQISNPKLQSHFSDEGQVLGKLHAVKLMVVQYKEKQTFSPRRSLSRNPVGFKHACRGKQSIKFGFTSHHDVISFCNAARDVMFEVHKRISKLKDEEHVATVKYHSRDELLIDVYDRLQAIVSLSGEMEACKVEVHLFASSFLSGDPLAKLTLNDKKMSGREVVRREDIIPTSKDGWIEIRDPQLHECCTAESYRENDDNCAGTCEFYPPDACQFELMRFKTTYVEEELPVIVKSSVSVKGARLQLRCVVRMSSKHTANKDPLTQIPCEDVMVRFPVPDEWGVFFRVDGRFRNHSVRAKRAAKQRRRPSAEAGVTMEASVGAAKYEHAYKAVVWRLPRLPEKNAVQNAPRIFTCCIELSSDQDLSRLTRSHDIVDCEGDGYRGGLDERYRWSEVEYSMSGSTASNVCVRSISLPNTDRAEKFVQYHSHYLYKVGLNLSAERVGSNGEEDLGTTLCSVQ